MTIILIILITAVLSGIVTLFFSNEMLVGLYDVVFNPGAALAMITGVEFFSLLMPVSYGFGISLIILKFLKKRSISTFSGLTATRTQTRFYC